MAGAMITAAVIPYHLRSAGALVVVSDGARTLASETIPVGRLEDEGGRVRRIIGPRDIAAVVARARALMGAHGARRALVEMLDGETAEAARGREIGAALLAWLPGAEAVPGERGELVDRLRRLLPAEGESGDGRGDAGGSEGRDRGLEGSRQGGLDRGGHVDVSARQDDGANQADLAASAQDGVQADRARTASQEPARADAPKLARRIAGIDPGSRHVAVTIVEGTAAPLRYVVSKTWHIGRDVPLAKPKMVKRNGAPFLRTTRHEVTDADVAQLLRDVGAFLAEHGADEAAVETAKFAHGNAGALLLRSNAIGGEIRGWLRAAGLPVRSVDARGGWRPVVAKLAGMEKAKQWPAAVRALVPDLPPVLPAEDREHVLDSAGCAAWAALPEPVEEKPAPAPRAKGAPRKPRARSRRAAGCLGEVCKARGQRGPQAHDPTCPVRVAALAKMAEKMKGNANARRSG
jgi:Holliday junction resolvasome RuvABC endonuclease subunit